MRKPNNYANTTAAGDFKKLPAGGYVCQILKAEETKSSTGKPMLKLALEICEGEYAGFFQLLWREKKLGSERPTEVKYPNEGMAYILTEDQEGNCSRTFKALCTALEESGTKVWSEKDELMPLKDAKVGVIFRREEDSYNGRTFWKTRPIGYRSVKRILDGDFTVPEDKYLPNNITGTGFQSVDSFSAAEDDIPF